MKLTIAPIQNMYKLIDSYKQQLEISYNDTEEEKRKNLMKIWNELLQKSNSKFNVIREDESTIKNQLIQNIVTLKKEIENFKIE